MVDGPIVRRAAVIGDIHAHDEQLARALEFIEQEPCDIVCAVGDIIDGPGDANRCCELLRSAGATVVAGNHERWFLEDERPAALPHASENLTNDTVEYLARLPKTKEMSTPIGTVMLCHGIGEDDMADLRPETKGYALQAIPTLRELMLRADLKLVMFGHTHIPMIREFPGLTTVNVGALGIDSITGVALLDFEQAEVSWVGWNARGEMWRHAKEIVLKPLG